MLSALSLALACADTGARAQDVVVDDFRQNCASCHTIGGGRLTGPDLRHVAERKDREWLIRFVEDPVAVLDSGDAYAQQLKEEARGAVMPRLPTMTRERAGALLDLIARESELEKSQFAGVQVSDRPLTAADMERGHDLFTGRLALENGGVSCIGCHTISGVGGLGGGRLGPDLTKVFERRQGRKGLAAWLSAPATPIMQATFAERPFESEEILGLIALFEDRAPLAEVPDSPGRLLFVFAGLAGTVGVLFLMGRIWRGRLRSVRRALSSRGGLKATTT